MSLEEVKKVVFSHKPKLREVIERHGRLSVFDYFNTVPYSVFSQIQENRQKELLEVIQEKTQKLCGKEIADEIIEQLKDNYFVSTAEHHGVVCHPFFFNNTLCRFLTQQERKKTAVLSLTCGSISLNNSSFPRGLLFHDQSLVEERLHFFSGQRKHTPVFSLRSYSSDKKSKMLEQIERMNLSEENKNKFKTIIEEIIFSPEILGQEFFSDQITLINQALWKLLPGHENVHLIHIEQEEIVRQLLLRYHLESETLIYNLLFSESIRSLFIKYFENITGAFSIETERGSILFWTIVDGERKSLWLKDNTLVSLDEKIKIDLEVETIREHLRNKTIMPTMALSFIVLSFYYGLTCGGGFSQINYLDDMKTAYLKFLEEAGYTEEQQLVESLETGVFCGEFVLATIASGDNHRPAFSLDMILANSNTNHARLLDLSKTSSLETVIDGMMPEYYKIITGTNPEIPVSFPKPLLYA